MTIPVKSSDFDVKALYDDGVRSILLLDFDEVLNFFPKFFHKKIEEYHPHRMGFHHSPFPYQKYRINVDTDVVSVLNNALSHRHVQLVWLTSWTDNIGLVADRCGVEAVREPLTIVYDQYMDHSAAKHVALDDMFWNDATQEVAPLMRLAWVDDRATQRFVDPDAFHTSVRRFGKVKVWTPEENIGLLLTDAQDVATFLMGDDNED